MFDVVIVGDNKSKKFDLQKKQFGRWPVQI